MDNLVSRRMFLAAGLGLPAGLSSAPDHPVRFTLDAETLDGGEQVTSLTLGTARVGRIVPSSLCPGTFTVHAKATSPIPLAPGEQILSEYDLDRQVTAAHLDRQGNIVLDLGHAEGQVGGGTLGFLPSRGRNVRLDLAYTITQNAPLAVHGGGEVTIPCFVQGRVDNPEVDAFSYHVSPSGLKYRLYSPFGRHGRRPLIVWLHGGGEGASLPDGYYDNETTLRANRGALGFATPRAQRIFAGAHVVAPQSTSYWIEDGDRFAPLLLGVIRDVIRRCPVDIDRIHVAGCSNGGYMSLKLTTVYPSLFATSVPICGVVQSLIPDEALTRITTPTWLVTSRDDTTVDPQANTVHAHDLIPRSLLSLYDHVVWNGHQFPGHWSWIYVARNDPGTYGLHLWQWMSRHHR
ncbi:hypothetical protein GCM10010168_62820 [Actinoplanes ianthinogenes]|uniref:Peptidase S9 prolyl oligopeptidase catalytic domain-containing protein n=1 Tax=Actinoplanes ianthinogenes TaxID=122358 RepID=A0ABM7LJM4_9ACTN|nr:PHB depolymerase family esterase [Actinoplanes ianthinogenes]BCJ39470.1 hypothetical protein Aiant_01270 [Actinoplanes ianthinogenes]GGR35866.1 hypothetical protein GCM10010168_62820 [Actinoplanes ianthinogenes]